MIKYDKRKTLVLKEDIIIPKGTEFVPCVQSISQYPYNATLGVGMKNSVFEVSMWDEALDEIGTKFKVKE